MDGLLYHCSLYISYFFVYDVQTDQDRVYETDNKIVVDLVGIKKIFKNIRIRTKTIKNILNEALKKQ